METEGKIAVVYAEAYLDLNESRLDEASNELREVVAVFQSDALVWKYFASPVMEPDDKVRMLKEHVKPGVSDTLYNFLGVLAMRRRFQYLPGIARVFTRLVNEKLGRRKVIVQSARSLEDGEVSQLTQALESFLDRKVMLEQEVKEEVIGGLVIRSEDLVIDTSLRSRLGRLKKIMLERKFAGEGYYEN